MKKPILVAVILQLVITIIEINGYQFGDIIVFPRKCLKNTAKPLYMHYAIYVGPKSERDIGQGDNDIVHRTGDWDRSNCRFDKLAKVRDNHQEKKDNYLDGIKGFKPGSPDEIAKRIEKALKNCERYDLLTRNCEHMATFIRYGESHSLQHGSACQSVINVSKRAQELLAKVREHVMDEANCTLHS
ncbi:phospholipase A and acyltransferase 1-like [Micropterus salmoides]|uniref:phospholipase A and acyltransferase 1-like n=1 Tax=Micropterus salmoides TaxID=27706 RepID=UPI0018EC979C|nr:phospholipase A and acyltransferase 1-like [Micropterus salmoides]